MSRDLNKCMFIGRLGNDPEIRYTPSGVACASLSIAVGDDYKDKQGNKVEITEWVRVSAFNKLAEIMGEYLKKGSKVFIEGKMKTRSWEQDGVKKYATEIIADNMQMLDSKNDVAPSKRESAPQQRQAPEQDNFDDDVPF